MFPTTANVPPRPSTIPGGGDENENKDEEDDKDEEDVKDEGQPGRAI